MKGVSLVRHAGRSLRSNRAALNIFKSILKESLPLVAKTLLIWCVGSNSYLSPDEQNTLNFNAEHLYRKPHAKISFTGPASTYILNPT